VGNLNLSTHRLRRLAKGTDKGPTHTFGIVKPGRAGNHFDRCRAVFDAFARHFQPQPFDRACRADADRAGKCA
jgi:hypothetical protein